MARIRLEGSSEDIEHQENQRFFTRSKGGIDSLITWTFQPEGNGTRLTTETEYTIPLPVLGKLAEAFIVKANDREGDILLANLKDRVEKEYASVAQLEVGLELYFFINWPRGAIVTDVSPPLDTIHPILGAVFPAYALLAGMQLDVFSLLKDGPLPVEEIATATGLNADRLERLLYILVVAGVLTVKDKRFSNTPASDYFLVRGRQAFYGDEHEFWSDIWQAVSRTADSIRTGVPQAHHDYRLMSQDQQLAFFRGLHSGTKADAYDLAKRYDFSTHQTVLDVAGGSGGLAIALTEVYPHLQATVAELPEVTPITKHFIIEEAATDRVQVIAADVVDGTLSGEFDVAILRAFTHILAPTQIGRVLKNVYGVIKPGGAVYIIASVLDYSRTSPVDAVYWDLVFLNIYNDGRAYTEQQYRKWLTEAGFIDIEGIVPQSNERILVAQKPV